MWIVFALGSAFFAGLTAIFAKLGIRHTDSTVATAIRTIVVVLCSWGMVLLTNAQSTVGFIEPKRLFFLMLSGLATGASWLCYFKALQAGPVAQVAAIDKSSTVLTILLAFILLHETISRGSTIGVVLIALGAWLMLDRKPSKKNSVDLSIGFGRAWLWYAAGSAIFASLSAILGKVGIENVDSNAGTAIRAIVVQIMSWIIVVEPLESTAYPVLLVVLDQFQCLSASKPIILKQKGFFLQAGDHVWLVWPSSELKKPDSKSGQQKTGRLSIRSSIFQLEQQFIITARTPLKISGTGAPVDWFS